MKKIFLILLATLLVSGLIFGGCAAPAPAPKVEPVVLKLVTFLPPDNIMMMPAHWFVDRVNERGEGNLKIDYVGGPSVISPFDQFEAVRTGAIDLVHAPMAYYGPNLPPANTYYLNEYDPADDRARGVHDFFVELHKRVDLVFLGKLIVLRPYDYTKNIYVNKRVETTADFKGLKIRSVPTYNAFLQALGATPVMMAWPEVYSAATTGVIDGVAGAGTEFSPEAFAEMFKYCIFPSFYAHDVPILVNLDRWEQLSKQQQDLLTAITIEIENECPLWQYEEVIKPAHEGMRAAGMQDIHLEDAEEYFNLASSSAWERAKAEVTPEDYAKLRELLVKE